MAEEVEKYEIVGETPIEPAQIFEQLRDVYDPEIPVNIVDLGLVYNVRLEENSVDVLMTLTAIGCPVAPEVMADVEDHLRQVAGVERVNVTLTFDPPWTPDKMTEDARWELGIG
ncbi:MAG TPA: iron-sulfur cluster assembly protein [Ktedonobacterales bacterium]|jgi:FeS assembly SUF system protein|nr:iron-sulfur cluster assembly protein [Ktedonobacterales bacterium]